MDPKVRRSLEEFLNPQVTRPRLIAASIYIASFEALKDSIVGRIRDYFWNGFDEYGDKIDPRYQSDVLARNKSPVYASLDWLKEHDAIDDHDLANFGRVKNRRNELAHKLFSILGSDGLPADFEQCFSDMVKLLRKIEVWWITNVEIPTNSDFDGKEINEDGIVPGRVMSMQLLIEIALGDEERSKFYYDAFHKLTSGGQQEGASDAWQRLGPRRWREKGELPMPIVSMFFGIIIRMYYEEHNPPHMHAEYQSKRAVVDFRGNVLKGDLGSKTALRLVREWIDLHEEELYNDWEIARAGKEIKPIDPLK